ncbi:uncharacterized protein V1518DRAFT_416628 [Limtongia smithiae]|uniref:uncharacterized protein n=1 Tax=Limtongia smithiae TaxID=1125753 RepID=UPI0034CE67C7
MAAHDYEFSENAIRREVRMYMNELRNEHEIFVSELLKSSRHQFNIEHEKQLKKAKLTVSTSDFILQKAEPSTEKNAPKLKFTVEFSSKRQTVIERPASINFVAPLPIYKDYTPLTIGVHVEDDELLRYLPYFGENGEEAGLDLEEIFEDRTETHAELLRKEKAQFLSLKFFDFMTNYGLFKIHFVAYFLYHVNPNSTLRKLVLPDKYEIDEKKRKLLEEHTRKLDPKLVTKVETMCRIFKDLTKTSIWEIINLYSASAIIEDKRASLRSSQASSAYNLDSYASLLCSSCFVHECPWHDASYVTLDIDGSIKSSTLKECTHVNKSTAAHKILPNDTLCSSDCFMAPVQPGRDKVTCEFTDEEISLIKMTAKVMIRNERTACLLVTLLNKPCREVHRRLVELKLTPDYAQEHPETGRLAHSEILANLLNKRKRKAQNGYPDDCSLSGNHLKRGNVNPCMHIGPCDASCPCVVSKVFCEKTCACPANCHRRWRGCKCTTSRCRTSTCECFKWNRECDPDLCRSCGADELLDPKNRDIIENKRYCKNVNLQRGVGRRVIVGPSVVSGWGLFMGEPIKQDEFLGEYKGELISQDEAERRGKIYDKRGVSFLFESTKDQCVDATRAGNKLRFINHSRQNPNCHARILFVNGVHRISFFTKRRIKEGEELFIDYGYTNKTMKFVPLEFGKGRAESHH